MRTTRDGLLTQLVTETDLKNNLRLRKRDYVEKSIKHSAIDDYLAQGWIKDRKLKTVTKVRQPKKVSVALEDRVWTLCAHLGFSFLNRNNQFRLQWDKKGQSQQIDVFAADDETVLLFECKAAQKKGTKSNFKKELEQLKAQLGGLTKSAKALFPEKKLKFKYIFVTSGYVIGDADKKRIEDLKILHFDTSSLNYFEDLCVQLGIAARYQFLGHIFDGQEVQGIQNKVPAIRGKMGGKTYYSFSIEPEKLLQLGYVLHRTKANKTMMPTYQRLIKKSRWKKINAFIEQGGYFANSVLVNIVPSKGKRLQFDVAKNNADKTLSEIGTLHLPKQYRSIFIIDGQHRIFGYSGSKYGIKNTIPVVAMVNLQKEEQVKLFMEINENQKAVPKNLRNTLNGDLLWTSTKIHERIKALHARLAISLAEDDDSILSDRIVVGENKKTQVCCLTMEAIITGVGASGLICELKKNEIEKYGPLYNPDMDSMFQTSLSFWKKAYSHILQNAAEVWNKGGDHILGTNKGIIAISRVTADIYNFWREAHPATEFSENSFFEDNENLFHSVSDFFINLDEDKNAHFKKQYGAGGPELLWRSIQQFLQEGLNDFNPEGLADFEQTKMRADSDEAFKLVRAIELHLNKEVKTLLEETHSSKWYHKGVPEAVQKEVAIRMIEKNFNLNDDDEPYENWQCLSLIHYKKIISATENWKKFGPQFVREGDESLSKDKKLRWLDDLNKLRNNNAHTYSVNREELDMLKELKNWLIDVKA